MERSEIALESGDAAFGLLGVMFVFVGATFGALGVSGGPRSVSVARVAAPFELAEAKFAGYKRAM